jgi:hypothetical protein
MMVIRFKVSGRDVDEIHRAAADQLAKLGVAHEAVLRGHVDFDVSPLATTQQGREMLGWEASVTAFVKPGDGHA